MDLKGFKVEGRVLSFESNTVKANLWPVKLNSIVKIEDQNGTSANFLVTGFHNDVAILSCLNSSVNISSNATVHTEFESLKFKVSESETIFDCLGPLKSAENSEQEVDLFQLENLFIDKQPVTEQFLTGIKAIDFFIPVGKGQRLAIIANAGVGKSALVKYLLANSRFDVAVIGLIGERGREVAEMIEFINQNRSKDLKLIVSTSAEPSIRRLLCCYSTTALASYYRKQGKNVLLIIDSLTRVARAIREIGLQNGEIPFRQGLTPSVFTTLPQFLEVAGKTSCGSITAFYTLLTHEQEEQDILVEEVKSLVDGHIFLDRKLAQKGVYPAINILSSLSRLAERFLPVSRLSLINRVRTALSELEADRELLYLAATPPPHLLEAVEVEKIVHNWITQKLEDRPSEQTLDEFESVLRNFFASGRNGKSSFASRKALKISYA